MYLPEKKSLSAKAFHPLLSEPKLEQIHVLTHRGALQWLITKKLYNRGLWEPLDSKPMIAKIVVVSEGLSDIHLYSTDLSAFFPGLFVYLLFHVDVFTAPEQNGTVGCARSKTVDSSSSFVDRLKRKRAVKYFGQDSYNEGIKKFPMNASLCMLAQAFKVLLSVLSIIKCLLSTIMFFFFVFSFCKK